MTIVLRVEPPAMQQTFKGRTDGKSQGARLTRSHGLRDLILNSCCGPQSAERGCRDAEDGEGLSIHHYNKYCSNDVLPKKCVRRRWPSHACSASKPKGNEELRRRPMALRHQRAGVAEVGADDHSDDNECTAADLVTTSTF